MAGSARRIVVEFLGEDKSLGKTMGTLDDKSGKLTSTLGKVGKAAAVGLGAAVVVAGKFALDSISAASDVEQAYGALDSVYGKNAKQVKKWAEGAADSVGLAKGEYANLSALVGSQLQGMGVETDAAAKRSDKLIKMGADLAATFGGSVKDAVEAVSSTLKGETDPIERYGVSIKASDVNARKAAMGLGDLTGAADKQATAQATLSLLTEQTGKAQGAFGRESDTLAGKQERLKAKFENLKSEIGEKLLPVAEKFVGWLLDDLMPAVEKFTRNHGPTIKRALENIGDAFRDAARAGRWMWDEVLQPTFSFMLDTLSKVSRFAADMLDALSKAPGMEWAGRAAEKLRKVADQADGIDRAIRGIPSYKAVTVGINFLYPKGKPTKNIEDTDDWINNLGNGRATASSMPDPLSGTTGRIKSAAKSLLGKMDVLLQPAGAALVSGLISGIDKRKTNLQTVLDKVSDQLNKAKDKLTTLLDARQDVVDSFKGFAASVFGADTATEDSPASVQKLIDFSAGQKGRAETLDSDVKALIEKGLSKDLINELIASGEQGMDQIHLLASATSDQIAALNANQAATQAALASAGLAAAQAVMGEQIAQAERDVKLAETVRDKLAELLKQQDKNTVVQLVLDGKVLHASLLKLKREKRGNLELA